MFSYLILAQEFKDFSAFLQSLITMFQRLKTAFETGVAKDIISLSFKAVEVAEDKAELVLFLFG